ncbi:hypothetical protein DNTS_001435 [Danionella cerebrum]|uniref:TMEM248/TMEM219 domain-containing protein n=1 Tax=Danionella cerebrum TaxID=2873325 RepID=A0A553R491_9TELE|nr:hypothetical protein DNTS_001435 [Danionella translucida]
MGQWRPVSNLREQASRRPPVVIFFLCLLTLSITFVCVGLYSQNHDIKNPDIGVDWNGVLGSLAALKFCKHLNESDTNLKEEEIPFQMINHDDQISITTSAAQVSLLVPLGFKGDVPDKMNISTTLMGRQLGMKGIVAEPMKTLPHDLKEEQT